MGVADGVQRMDGTAAVDRHFTASAFVIHAAHVLLLLHATKGLWLPPGGHVEPNESPVAAAVREVREETGLGVLINSPRTPAACPPAQPRPEDLLEFEVEPGHFHMDLVFFATLAPGADPHALRPNEEAAALRWWSAAELRAAAHDPTMPPDVVTMGLAALARSAQA